MQSFRHIAPPLRLFQGPDSLGFLQAELQRLGSQRAVIFCGSTLGRDAGILDMIRSAMSGRCAGVYASVRSQSPLPAVEEAAIELQRLEADAVIAVGGGSAIVTARAASILLAENAPAHALCTRRDASRKLHSPRLNASKLPQLVIPTTPTTAIVKAGSAMLDPADGHRLALYDPKTRAQAVFIHPELLKTASRDLFASAGLNTLALAVEGLMSRTGDPMADAMLMHAIRLLARHLGAAPQGDDMAVRAEMMAASLLCGTGSDYTGAGAALTMGHAISARFGIDSGVSDAIVLPCVLRFNAGVSAPGLKKLAAALSLPDAEGDSAPERAIAALESLFLGMKLPRRLRDVTVPREALPEVAEVCMDDWYLQNNPRPIHDAAQLVQLLEEVW
jgi:alcohol dehydrogenase class IV